MKRLMFVLSLTVLGGCCSLPEKRFALQRTAQVVRVPQEKLAAVRACCLDADIRGGRSGVYLRKIDGETYLFHYLEKGKDTDPVCFQELTKMMGASTDCFEPMERIFYEEGAADKEPEGEVTRIAMFTGLKPEKEKDYRLLHDNPWPDVIAAIHRANFRHFSIFLEEINGKLYLFGWLEYIGSDIAADDVVNKKDPASIRWWRETDACQIAPPDANGGMWGGMEELMFFGKE